MQILVGALTIKALRKCFGSRICREVNRQNDLPSILIAVKSHGLIPIAIEPSSHRDHRTVRIGRLRTTDYSERFSRSAHVKRK